MAMAAVPAVGQDEPLSYRQRLLNNALFTSCADVQQVFVMVDGDMTEAGLADRKTIEAQVKRRLRAAGIYSSGENRELILTASVDAMEDDGTFFWTVNVGLSRDLGVGKSHNVRVWERRWYSLIEGADETKTAIRATIADYVDQFTHDYSRANEGACE